MIDSTFAHTGTDHIHNDEAIYIHHGTMFSYYSAKTRAYLSYKQIPFVERYDGRDLSRRIAEVTYKVMIPVVETPDGQILQDTTAMHYRWNDPRAKAFAIGEKVAAQMMSYLPRLGISDESGQTAVENFFAHTSKQLNQCVGPTTYAFGPHPSLIDFCLFTGYYAHHYRDHGDAADFLKSQTPDLCYYLDNLHAAHCAPADIGWLDFLQQPPAYRLLHDDYQIKRGLTLS